MKPRGGKRDRRQGWYMKPRGGKKDRRQGWVKKTTGVDRRIRSKDGL